jgi:hypothetical protein
MLILLRPVYRDSIINIGPVFAILGVTSLRNGLSFVAPASFLCVLRLVSKDAYIRHPFVHPCL